MRLSIPFSLRFLTLLIVLAAGAACAASPFASPAGYTMDIPAGWGVNAGVNGEDVLLVAPIYHPVPGIDSTKVSPTISVAVAKIPEGVSGSDRLKILQASAVATLQSVFPGFQSVGNGPATLGSLNGFFVSGTYTPQGAAGAIQVRRIYAAHGKSMFRLTETALASEFDIVDRSFSATEASFAPAPFDTQAYTCPYGFQLTPPAGWSVHPWAPPNLVSFVENADEGNVPATILVRARMGLSPVVDEQMIADNRDEWNGKYNEEPGYAPIDQGTIMIGGEKAFYTVFSEDAPAPENRARKWHVMYPRNGVLVEFFVSYPESDHRKYDRQVRDCIQSWIWCPPDPAAEAALVAAGSASDQAPPSAAPAH